MTDALLKLSKSKGGSAILESIRVERFRPLDSAGLSRVRQARIESCYLSAQAFYKVGGQDTSFRNSQVRSRLNRSVTAFYAKQRQRAQFDDCVKQ